MAALRRIFSDWFERVGIDPTVLGVEAELAGLEVVYAPPRGALLMVVDADGTLLGGGAMRPLPGPGDCGLTAAIILDAARGRGLGRLLMGALIERARQAGCRRMHHDISTSDAAATALWQELGFAPSPPYFPNPRPGSRHMTLDLAPLD